MHHLMKKMLILEQKQTAQRCKYIFKVSSSKEQTNSFLEEIKEKQFLVIMRLYND